MRYRKAVRRVLEVVSVPAKCKSKMFMMSWSSENVEPSFFI